MSTIAYLPDVLSVALLRSLRAAYRIALPHGGQRTALRNAAEAVAEDEVRAYLRRVAA